MLEGDQRGVLEVPAPAGAAPADPPAWIHDAVVYQIFVDRFARGRPARDARHAVPWGSAPGPRAIMGGDLLGIIERLPYLEDLGANVLCLTPIFLASSYHHYDTYDYYRIDPRLGTLEIFRDLVSAAHRRGMRILLDGVFSHCGRGFFPFFDTMENGAGSAYRHWFHIEGFPVDAYGAARYRSWLGTPSLPEFDLANPEARAYLLDVARYWTAQGIDGWRLDAVPHVRHRPFWRELGRAVRSVNPEAYLLAEIWGDPSSWLESGDLDGATNYPLREQILKFVLHRAVRPSRLAGRLAHLTRRQTRARSLAMLNLLGSHDTPRLWTLAGGDAVRVHQALLLQFFFPGIPAIYYGDEIALEGGRDPDNRGTMDWDAGRQNAESLRFLRWLTRIRRSLAPLRHGDWRSLLADDRHGISAFARRWRDEQAILLIHGGEAPASFALDLGNAPAVLVDLLTEDEYPVADGALNIARLAPGSVLLLCGSQQQEISWPAAERTP